MKRRLEIRKKGFGGSIKGMVPAPKRDRASIKGEWQATNRCGWHQGGGVAHVKGAERVCVLALVGPMSKWVDLDNVIFFSPPPQKMLISLHAD